VVVVVDLMHLTAALQLQAAAQAAQDLQVLVQGPGLDFLAQQLLVVVVVEQQCLTVQILLRLAHLQVSADPV
jgi:hypothetical protein